MAAKRSGSGWHVDPANTTGWLALIQGAKLWGMYPPSVFHIPGEFKVNWLRGVNIGLRISGFGPGSRILAIN